MYMRMVQVRVKMAELGNLQQLYRQKVIPALRSVQGCRYAGMLQRAEHSDECISLTLWDSEAEAIAYEQGGLFTSLLEETRPFLSESTETTIQFSKDLKIEMVPVPEEPVMVHFPVAAVGRPKDDKDGQRGSIWVRIVSLKLKKGKTEEFKRGYAEQVIPLLESVKGCRYVYLAERTDRPDEVLSVTSWDSPADAERYEQGGLYRRLLETQRPLLSDLSQWKMDREEKRGGTVATSEDVVVEHYTVLVAESFK